MAENRVRIVIEASGKDAQQAVDGVSRKLRDLSKDTEAADRSTKTFQVSMGSLKGTLFSMKGALTGLGIAPVVRSFVEAASTAEGYRVRLDALLRSQAEGNRLLQEMNTFATRVPFEYREIMGAATQLAGVMRGGVDEIRQWMPIIADLATVSGLSIEETTGQIIRMYNAGAASADMFRERGILAFLGFKAGVSYEAEETIRMILDAWKRGNSKFRGAAAEYANTWEGAMSMVSGAWFQFRNQVMETGPFQAMKESLQAFLDYLNTKKGQMNLAEWAKSMALGVLSTFQAMSSGAQILAKIFYSIKETINIMTIAYTKLAQEMLSISEIVPSFLYVGEKPSEREFLAMRQYLAKMGADAAESLASNLEEEYSFDKYFSELREKIQAIRTQAAAAPIVLSTAPAELSGGGAVQTAKQAARDIAVVTEQARDRIATAMHGVTGIFNETFENGITAQAKWIKEQDKAVDAAVKAGSDFANGWRAGMAEYVNMARDSFRQSMVLAMETARSMEQSFSNFFFDAMQGKLKSFEDYLNSFVVSVQRAVADMTAQRVTGSLISGFSGLFSAKGNVFDRGQVLTFASGGVVSSPTLFPLGVMGEAGPEAILPLQRTRSGDLGVRVAGSDGGDVINNYFALNISAMDTRSMSQAFDQHKRQIVGMVQDAYNRRGQRGPLR